ncbi:MAG: hypothetical protein HS127_07820 [Planctomycetia bacterium]|nr:hypothetical protein [Planctomycetia bacterium]
MDKSLRSNLTPIIVIDEAHLLKMTRITDLRLLVSSPLDSSLISKSSSRDRNTSNISSKRHPCDFAMVSVHYHIHPLLKPKPLHRWTSIWCLPAHPIGCLTQTSKT